MDPLANRRLCEFDDCVQHIVQDPTVIHRFLRGQYIGLPEYKGHQRKQNARVRAASQYSTSRTSVHVPLFPDQSVADENNSNPTAEATTTLKDQTDLQNLSPEADDIIYRRLASMAERLKHLDLDNALDQSGLVFQKSPTDTSPPMIIPDAELLELAENIPSNTTAMKEERWLRSAEELAEELGVISSNSEIQQQATNLRLKITASYVLLLELKMRHWERLRKSLLGVSRKAKRVNTGKIRPFPLTVEQMLNRFLFSALFVPAFSLLASNVAALLRHGGVHASFRCRLPQALQNSARRLQEIALACYASQR